MLTRPQPNMPGGEPGMAVPKAGRGIRGNGNAFGQTRAPELRDNRDFARETPLQSGSLWGIEPASAHRAAKLSMRV